MAEIVSVAGPAAGPLLRRAGGLRHLGRGPGDRERPGLTGAGPRKVITGPGILEPGPDTRELTLTGIFPGAEVADVKARTGWELAVPAPPALLSPPSGTELAALRSLQAATGA